MYKVKAIIDFYDKSENPPVKRIANKSIWEIKDKERFDTLLEKNAIIEVPKEKERITEKKTLRETSKRKFKI